MADETPAVVALVTVPDAPPIKYGVWRRFGAAMGYPFRGMSFAFQHPRLLVLCAGPVITAILASALLFSSAISFAHRLAQRAGHGFFAQLLFLFLMVFVVAVVAYFGYVALISIAAAPFCAAISDRVEAIHTSTPLPPQSLLTTLREAGRGVLHALLRVGCYLLISLPLSFFSFVLPPFAPVTISLQFVITSYFLAYDYLDYPLSRRHATFAAKWKYVDDHRAESLGFGFMLGLLFLIPVFNVLVAPFAAAGASLLHADLRSGTVVK